jgi:type II secretory pathway component HofQ
VSTIVTTEQTDSMMSMIERAARDPQVDIDKLERLFALLERMIAEEKKTAYAAAMSVVQAKIQPVYRDARNDQTNSTYARLEAISAAIKPIYTAEGFSLSFDTADSTKPDHMRIVCEVMHSAGHSVIKHFDLPYDNVGMKGNANKTMVHASGSTVSYGRRYLTLMVFNVPLTNEDNDGNSGGGNGVEYITDKQAADLQCLMDEVNANKANFLKYCKVDSLDRLPASKFKGAVEALQQKRKQ